MILPAVESGAIGGVREIVKSMRKVRDLPQALVPFAPDTGHANYYVVDASTGAVGY